MSVEVRRPSQAPVHCNVQTHAVCPPPSAKYNRRSSIIERKQPTDCFRTFVAASLRRARVPRSFVGLSVASRLQRVSLIVIPFCLSVWMSVGHSATYNQIWSAISSDPCKPFWIPYLPYFRCQRENMQNFAYFQAKVTHRAI